MQRSDHLRNSAGVNVYMNCVFYASIINAVFFLLPLFFARLQWTRWWCSLRGTWTAESGLRPYVPRRCRALTADVGGSGGVGGAVGSGAQIGLVAACIASSSAVCWSRTSRRRRRRCRRCSRRCLRRRRWTLWDRTRLSVLECQPAVERYSSASWSVWRRRNVPCRRGTDRCLSDSWQAVPAGEPRGYLTTDKTCAPVSYSPLTRQHLANYTVS